MRIARSGLLLLLIVGIGFSAGAQELDISITSPGITLGGDLSNFQDELDGFLSGENSPTTLLENELDALELDQYADLSMLARAIANAGSAASHLGTQRAFSDFRIFALSIGSGAALTVPDIDPSYLETLQEDVESSGDIYVGAAIQPITAALGVNLSRWIPRTRADVKLGYANLADGTIGDGVSFSALSVGVGANYQILQSRQLPLGFIRWRGVSLASGLMFQRNETDISVSINDQALTQELYAGTFVNETDPTDNNLGEFYTENDTDRELIATLLVEPSVNVAAESTTYTIPLEATTGLRLLWLLDVNVGAGVDLVFGNSEVVFGADAALKVDAESGEYVESTSPGSVGFGVTNTESPQFFRPRVTGGVGLNLGPIKLDVPLMLYFDEDGNTVMGGVNVGLVF